jgi:predicted nucleic acid-binding protein
VRYVITPDVALSLARDQSRIAEGVQLVAPTLIRSQVLSRLYGMVRAGEMSEADARDALAYIRALRMRLLGDRVLQDVAWHIATELGRPDTFDAEYIALTRLQADALVTGDPELRRAASTLVTVTNLKDLVD